MLSGSASVVAVRGTAIPRRWGVFAGCNNPASSAGERAEKSVRQPSIELSAPAGRASSVKSRLPLAVM